MCRDDGELIRNTEVVEDLGGSTHRGQVGVGAHYDAHERRRLARLALLSGQRGQHPLGLGGGGCAHVDVPHLAARLGRRLTIPVNGRARHGHRPRHGRERGLQLAVVGTDDVEHGGGADLHRGVTQRETEHGTEVLLVLLSVACVERVVARVMRPRRDLVQQHRAVGHGEELDAEDAGALEGGDGRGGDVSRCVRGGGGHLCRRKHRMAHRVALLGHHRRVRHHLPRGRPRDHHRELALEGAPSLDVELDTTRLRESGEGRLHLGGRADNRIAAPVVRRRARLEHQRVAPLASFAEHRRGVGRIRVFAELHSGDGGEVALLHQFILDGS
mmetsp:Transcript_51280/g.109582  ORF Transcript_51280/g.109582 Transcript_51280/m.109582 type:complete len:329 (+) Transcript_51280:883-1869(+)